MKITKKITFHANKDQHNWIELDCYWKTSLHLSPLGIIRDDQTFFLTSQKS